MKQVKSLVILISATVLYKIVFEASKAILLANGLAYRMKPEIWLNGAFYLLLLAVFAKAIQLLYRLTRWGNLDFDQRLMSHLGIVFMLGAIFFSGLHFLGFLLSESGPEHEVVHRDEKMVVKVRSFLQVQVYYYDYVNGLVQGSELRIYEDYGNGSWDPFTREGSQEPERTTYFDENGKVMEEYENYD